YLVLHAAPARSPARSACARPWDRALRRSVAPAGVAIPTATNAAAQQKSAAPLSTYAKPNVLFTGPIMNRESPARRPGSPVPIYRRDAPHRPRAITNNGRVAN